MRPLSVPSAMPVRTAGRVEMALVSLVFVLAGCVLGCDEPSGPRMPAAIVIPKTPEEKLDRVMERMKSALADAQAASGVGVVSERTSQFRLIPPPTEGGPYTAEVTITTKVALARAPAAATLPPSEDEDAAATTKGAAEDGEQPRPDNGVTRRAAAQSLDEQSNVYELAYDGDRWTLVTEPKSETEKLILDFALGN